MRVAHLTSERKPRRKSLSSVCDSSSVGLLLSSTSIEGELWRRGADGSWPDKPELLVSGDSVALETIGFTGTLAAFYHTTSLA